MANPLQPSLDAALSITRELMEAGELHMAIRVEGTDEEWAASLNRYTRALSQAKALLGKPESAVKS